MTAAQVRSATAVVPADAEVLVKLPNGERVPIVKRAIEGKWLVLEVAQLDDTAEIVQ